MNKITALRMRNGCKEKMVSVYLDGKFAFSLGAEVVVHGGLRLGQEITQTKIDLLNREDRYRRCLSAAIRYVSYRPRSEFEIRERLARRDFDSECIEVAVERLKQQGLIDDIEFATSWKYDRQIFSPRSKRLTELELRRKGVSQEAIEQAVADVSDEVSAYRAALNRVSRLPASDYRGFRNRLAGYLSRRGFNYQIINKTVDKLWQEIKGSTD